MHRLVCVDNVPDISSGDIIISKVTDSRLVINASGDAVDKKGNVAITKAGIEDYLSLEHVYIYRIVKG